ncbi:XrtA/PEP-CTERM system amidotransferase [Rugamonas apoptosis]|uniref:asparagine synthase (glutamine-hydrolyzing) n=1 Tax=Rugamonas apoptosis TaxID=2758570 RepID=A0A7W2F8Y2_9BURK|nr:XrtA/PEP-CTERM system amidotransferase [Rugamonas apoptosis]MBA5687275.1 amidotransferase 1, exosortase A system-associated [Rugamonas apoptosis]
MCAIVGLFDMHGMSEPDHSLLERMNASMRHRGPDGGGSHHEPGLGLAHRRLSVIDVSAGHQPMYNEDHSVVLVYNGEIYNFQSLVRELRQYGHVFRTHCDTEVIVHAWEQWGVRCVERFRGMFAFALWDRNAQTLFLARDRLGVKPLYYAQLDHGQLVFASELKALLLHPAMRRTLDPMAVEEYFAYGYVPDPRTILAQARKLPPGHTLCVRKGGGLGAPQPYWDVPFAPVAVASEAQAAEELTARLADAVRMRLVADVPLGAFLSGGVDSSAVVAMMAQCTHEPVNTCAIGFADQRYDESAYARLVASHCATRHHELRLDGDDTGLIDRLATLYDEPFADSSALPTYRVCQLARQRVTVALSGDGGDENLAGYARYRWHVQEERWRARIPALLRRPVCAALGHAYPRAPWLPRPLRAKATLQAMARDTIGAYFHSIAIMDDDARTRLFSPSFKASLGGYRAIDVLRRHAAASPAADPLSQVQYLDLKTYLPGDILTKVDRASMAHGLEVRVPLLDHELVSWISGLPPQMKLKGNEGKHLFKLAMAPYLPDAVLHRPKMGFAVPMAGWVAGPLRPRLQRCAQDGALADSGIFNMDYVRQLVDEQFNGQRDHSAALWSLLMFDCFLRQVLDQPEGAERRAA